MSPPPVAVQVIVDLTQERDYLSSQQTLEVCRNLSMSSPERGLDAGVPNGGGTALNASGLSKEERQHLSVELADTKAKLRRYRQELYVVFSLFICSSECFLIAVESSKKISTGTLWIAGSIKTPPGSHFLSTVTSVLVVKAGDVSTGQPITGGFWF